MGAGGGGCKTQILSSSFQEGLVPVSAFSHLLREMFLMFCYQTSSPHSVFQVGEALKYRQNQALKNRNRGRRKKKAIIPTISVNI